MSPYQPQMFYKVTNKNHIIQPDDIIASRCTINSMNRNEVTFTGDRHEDEMYVNIFFLIYIQPSTREKKNDVLNDNFNAFLTSLTHFNE